MVKTETKPIWTSSSFLIYAGGLTVLGGAIAALAYLSTQFPGDGEGTAWSLLILVILYGIAQVLRVRGRWLAAGIFAFTSVIAWAVFVAVLFKWWGGNVGAPFTQWSWPRTVWILLVLLSAAIDRMQFKFPFIRVISAVFFFLLVLSVMPAGHTAAFVWALLVGLLYLLVGTVIDKPSAFWLHLVGGALIGVALLDWFHTSDGDFAAISIFSLLFVLVAYSTKRSIWAVYGTIGFFAATIHYLVGSPTELVQGVFGLGQQCSISGLGPGAGETCTSLGSQISPWSPALAFGLLGFWLVLLGMLGKRKRGHTHTAVVVQTPAPPAA